MSTYPSDDGRGFLTAYLKPGFEPLIHLLARHYPLEDERGIKTFCALLNSPLSYDEIDYRGYTLFAGDTTNICRHHSSKVQINPIAAFAQTGGLSSGLSLIHPNALIHFTTLLMEVLPYHSITTSESRTTENWSLLPAAEVVFGGSGEDIVSKELIDNGLQTGQYRNRATGTFERRYLPAGYP